MASSYVPIIATSTSEFIGFPNEAIKALGEGFAETSSAKAVYKIANDILTLIRGKRIDKRDSRLLSESCLSVCQVLKNTVQGKNPGDLHEYEKIAVEGLERVMRGTERTLRGGVSTPHAKYNQEQIENNVLEVQRLLDSLNALGSCLDGDLRVGEPEPRLTPDEICDAVTAPASESAYERLIKRDYALHELPFLIEAIFSSEDRGDMTSSLPRDVAQTFIDVINEALDRHDLSLSTKSKCLKLLYRLCDTHSILPMALNIPVYYDRTSCPLYIGGYADVWKGNYCGQEVAVKTLRVYSSSELRKIVGRFCKEVVLWRFLRHPNILPLMGVSMSDTRLAMVSEWMTNGNIVRYIKANPSVDRPMLLTDVAKGLNYMHGIGMIHGDLKGANIMIDGTCHARLADFGLLTIISDPPSPISSSSHAQGGTVRWMSPELICPDRFGFEKSHRTKSSDCYALGMVIYEVISGFQPFYGLPDFSVALKVANGECPPREATFTEPLWNMLESCWAYQPNDRPSAEGVLQYLESGRDDWNLWCSPGVGPWVNDRMTAGDTPASPDLNGATDPTLGPISSAFRPSAAGECAVKPDHEAHPNLSASMDDSSKDGNKDLPEFSKIIGGAWKPDDDVQSRQLPQRPPSSQRLDDIKVCNGGFAMPSAWIKIPQRLYMSKLKDRSFSQLQAVSFNTGGVPGFNMRCALNREFSGLDGGDDPALECTASAVSIRLHFPGYPANPQVSQIASLSWNRKRGPITRSKLAYEIAKRVDRYLSVLAAIPIDPLTDSQWTVEEGCMELRKMYLVNIAWVSRGSIQPEIWFDPTLSR